MDTNAGIAAAIHEAIEYGCTDSGEIVGWVIGLNARAKPARQTDRRAKARDHRNLFRNGDQVLVAHQFRHPRGHFRRDAWRQGCERFSRRFVGEQKIAKFPGRHGSDWRESILVMRIDDEPRYLIRLVWHQGIIEKLGKRQVGKHDARGNAFFIACSGKSGEPVTSAIRRGARQKRAQIREDMACAAGIASVWHELSCSPGRYTLYFLFDLLHNCHVASSSLL